MRKVRFVGTRDGLLTGAISLRDRPDILLGLEGQVTLSEIEVLERAGVIFQDLGAGDADPPPRTFVEVDLVDLDVDVIAHNADSGAHEGQFLALDARADSLESDSLATTPYVAVSKEAPLNIEYPEYGADSARTAAQNAVSLQLAVDALPAAGGELLVPNAYDFDTMIDCEGRRAVAFVGIGGERVVNEAPRSRLRFTGTGAGAAIDARFSRSFTMRNIGIHHTSGSFTGTLVDLAGTSADDGDFALFPRFEDVWFMGWDALSPGVATPVDLKLIVDAAFRNCSFESLKPVKGAVADPATSFSNSVYFDHCYWSRMVDAAVLNPGQQWTFLGCIFQQLNSGLCGAVICNFRTQALAFIGCGFWDGGSSGIWLSLKGEGTAIHGCLFGGNGGTAKAIDASNATNVGVAITGNRFQNFAVGVDCGASKRDFEIAANSWDTVTDRVVATDQPYAETTGIYQPGISGDYNVFRSSPFAYDIEAALRFPVAITTANAANNTIFRDSADNIIKIKDNGGTVRTLY